MVSGATGTPGGGGGKLAGGTSPFDVFLLLFLSLSLPFLSLSFDPSFLGLLDLRLSKSRMSLIIHRGWSFYLPTLGALSSPLRGDKGSSSTGSSAHAIS